MSLFRAEHESWQAPLASHAQCRGELAAPPAWEEPREQRGKALHGEASRGHPRVQPASLPMSREVCLHPGSGLLSRTPRRGEVRHGNPRGAERLATPRLARGKGAAQADGWLGARRVVLMETWSQVLAPM